MACQLTFGLPAVTSSTSYLSCDQGLRRRGAACVAQACMANNMVNTDHHSVLWVRRNASRNEIKSAYENLARRYHPDVCKKRGSRQRFKQINRAYQRISVLFPGSLAGHDRRGKRLNWKVIRILSGQRRRI